ncbi:Uncharacterised protein [uncultured Eubacterium sp.]|nr:Uncharacterised protein [uncultured Eubacterium sp.]
MKEKESTSTGHKILTTLGIVLCIILIPILIINCTLIIKSYTNKDEVPSVGVISGTFAKYTTSATGSDSARVATWGVDKNNASITLDNLFSDTYDNVKGVDSDVIAPGTTGSANFEFKYSGKADAPEVAYTFKVDTEGSTISDDIKNNTNIVWSLDNEECTAADGKTSWEVLLEKIASLDGNKANDKYAAGELPTGFDRTKTHTVSWEWKFDKNVTGASDLDTKDTEMGNKSILDNVKLQINIKAEQID